MKKNLNKKQIPATGVNLNKTVSHQDLFGKSLTIQEVQDIFSSMNVRELLPAIAKLIALHYSTKGKSGDVLKLVFERAQRYDYGTKVNHIINKLRSSIEQDVVLNSPQMLLSVIRFLLAYGKDFEVDIVSEKQDLFCSVTAMYLASILVDYYQTSMTREDILMESIQNGIFNRNINGKIVVQRSVQCYLRIAEKQQQFLSNEYMDISQAFEQVTDLELKEYLKFLTALISTYDNEDNGAELIWTGKLFPHKEQYMQILGYNSDETEKLFNLISGKIEDFAEDIRTNIHERWDFSVLRNCPITFVGDRFYSLDNKFLIDKIWDGLFWTMIDRMDETTKNKFRPFFGRIFETYCTELMMSLKGVLRADIIPEFEYLRGQRSPDLFLDYGKDLIVIDFKAKRLKMNDTLVKGNILEYEKDIEGVFLQPAEKIYKHLKKFSELKNIKININKYERIHCIVISQGSIVGLSESYKEMDKLIREKGLYKSLPIRTWNLLNIDEYEILIGLLESGKNLPNLLMRKASSEKYKFLSFNDFMAYTNQKFTIPSYLRQNFDEWLDEIIPQ